MFLLFWFQLMDISSVNLSTALSARGSAPYAGNKLINNSNLITRIALFPQAISFDGNNLLVKFLRELADLAGCFALDDHRSFGAWRRCHNCCCAAREGEKPLMRQTATRPSPVLADISFPQPTSAFRSLFPQLLHRVPHRAMATSVMPAASAVRTASAVGADAPRPGQKRTASDRAAVPARRPTGERRRRSGRPRVPRIFV